MSPPAKHDNDFLLDEMRRMHDENRADHAKLWEELTDQGKDLAGLKVKAGVWGGLAGLIPVAIMGCWVFIKHFVNGAKA